MHSAYSKNGIHKAESEIQLCLWAGIQDREYVEHKDVGSHFIREFQGA